VILVGRLTILTLLFVSAAETGWAENRADNQVCNALLTLVESEAPHQDQKIKLITEVRDKLTEFKRNSLSGASITLNESSPDPIFVNTTTRVSESDDLEVDDRVNQVLKNISGPGAYSAFVIKGTSEIRRFLNRVRNAVTEEKSSAGWNTDWDSLTQDEKDSVNDFTGTRIKIGIAFAAALAIPIIHTGKLAWSPGALMIAGGVSLVAYLFFKSYRSNPRTGYFLGANPPAEDDPELYERAYSFFDQFEVFLNTDPWERRYIYSGSTFELGGKLNMLDVVLYNDRDGEPVLITIHSLHD